MATDGTSRRRIGGRRASALLVSIALLAGCAGGGDTAEHAADPSAATASTGPEPELASAPTTWDDGYDHVVVLTENAVTGGADDEIQAPETTETDDTAAAEDASEDGTELAPPAPSSTTPSAPPTTTGDTTTTTTEPVVELGPQTRDDGIDLTSGHDVVVVHSDGSTETAKVPDGSLTKVFPRTADEIAALAAHASEPLAILVADDLGVVGPAGRRYVMVPGQLIAVDETSTTTTTAPSAPTPSTSASEEERPAPVTTVDSSTGAGEATDEPAGPPTGPPRDEAILQVILDLPGTVEAQIVAPGVIAVVTAGDRSAIRKVRGVVSVEDDTLFDLADDPDQSKQWAIENTGSASQAGGWSGTPGADANVKAAWTVTEGRGITVAVIDSGVDVDHPDLAANVWTNTREVCGNGRDDDGNGFVDDCRGWDFGANDNDPRPESGTSSAAHGTHVAGLVGAARNGTGIVGIAPQSKLMALKVAMPSGQLSSSAIYSAIVYAVDNGAKVINLSLGTNPGTPRAGVATMEQAVAYAGSRGVTVVAAAGNSGVDIGASAVYPANFSLFYSHVITIGASTNSDTRASFSNFGSPVNLYAPGWFMWSTIPGSWGWMSGTSMAAPVVAGAVADLLATGQVVTPQEVRARLLERSDPTSAGPRLDLGSAVGVGLPPSVSVTYGGADALVPDQPSTMSIQVAGQRVPADAARVQVSVATLVGGQVYAVAGLPVTFTVPGVGPTSLVTDDNGAFAPMTIDPSSLAVGWTATADVALPAGQFAIVTELLAADGTPVGGSHVGYLTLAGPSSGDGSGGSTSTLPGTPGAPGAPVTTAPTAPAPGTTVPGGAGGGTPTTQPGTGTTLPQVSTTLPSGSGNGGTNSTLPQAPTTAPPSGGGNGGTDSTLPQVSTTVPQPPTSPTSPTTAPPTVITTPSPTTPTAPTPTTMPGATTPSTMPTPSPDTSGQWRLDAMTPRSATTAGGTAVELQGRFPTSVPVYVWFGSTVVEAQSTGTSLFVRTPVVNVAGVVDVSVKFRTTTSHELTLANAFSFIAPPSSGTGGGSTVTTVPSGGGTGGTGGGTGGGSGGGSSGGTPTTTPSSPTPTPPPASPTPTTSPSSPTPTTSPSSPTPTTSPAPGVTSPAPTTTIPSLGSLTLRVRPSSGALSRLSAASWPANGCRTATCSATTV